MNTQHDDPIEALLRKGFDGPVPDDGFSARVMARLPPRPRRIGWPLWLGIAAGALACWSSLVSSPVLSTGWRAWIAGQLTSSAIIMLLAMVSMSLLALCWSLAEAEDR